MAVRRDVRNVLGEYPIQVRSLKIVQNEPIKAVWRVESDHGPMCLKLLPFGQDKARFVLAAQAHLARSSARVAPAPIAPDVIPTKDGELFVPAGKQVYSLSTWVAGRKPVEARAKELAGIMKALAWMHKASVGFQPPPGSLVSTKLSRWPDHYRKMLDQMSEWKRIAESGKGLAHVTYLRYVQPMLAAGENALGRLQRSHYHKWCEEAATKGYLSHQDYGATNTTIQANGWVSIIDFDSITLDVPARDLRKMIHRMAGDRPKSFATLLPRMLVWYESVNKLSEAEKEVLWIDLYFPHQFHSAAKNCYLKGELIAEKIRQGAALERMKNAVLRAELG